MFSYIVGNVDWNSAAVLIMMFVTTALPISIFIAKRRSRLEVNNDFELEKIKLTNSATAAQRQAEFNHESALVKYKLEKEVEIARIEAGTITSHARNVSTET